MSLLIPGRADPAHRLSPDRRLRRRADRGRRRQDRGQPDHRGRPDAGLRREPERQYARGRPRREDPHAGADRGSLPHLVLGRARAARSRSQAARGADDGLRGQKRRAGAALRVHRRGERRRSPPDRRDDPRHGQGRRDPGPAHGGLGARHLRDLGHARLEPVLLEARHGRPCDLRRRRRGGSQGGPRRTSTRAATSSSSTSPARGCFAPACRRRRPCTPSRRSPSPWTRRTSATGRSPRTSAGTTA